MATYQQLTEQMKSLLDEKYRVPAENEAEYNRLADERAKLQPASAESEEAYQEMIDWEVEEIEREMGIEPATDVLNGRRYPLPGRSVLAGFEPASAMRLLADRYADKFDPRRHDHDPLSAIVARRQKQFARVACGAVYDADREITIPLDPDGTAWTSF